MLLLKKQRTDFLLSYYQKQGNRKKFKFPPTWTYLKQSYIWKPKNEQSQRADVAFKNNELIFCLLISGTENFKNFLNSTNLDALGIVKYIGRQK